MHSISIARSAGLLGLVALTGLTASCRGGTQSDRRVAVLSGADTLTVSVRGIWLGMADDPLHHIMLARQMVDRGDDMHGARQLELGASFLRWGELYASGPKERRKLVATAQQLEDDARALRTDQPPKADALDAALSRGLRVLADQQVGLALEQWQEGEHARTALLLHAAADEVEQGRLLSGAPPDGSIDRALEVARSVADRLDSVSPPDENQVRNAIAGLRDSVGGLGDVLTAGPVG